MSATMPKAWQRAETMPTPLDVLIARARVGGFADLADTVDALMTVAARSGLAIDTIRDAVADALENLLDEARE